MNKYLLLFVLNLSGTPHYEIGGDSLPSGDSKVVIDYIDPLLFIVYINERGAINSVDIYSSFRKLCADLIHHKITVKY